MIDGSAGADPANPPPIPTAGPNGSGRGDGWLLRRLRAFLTPRLARILLTAYAISIPIFIAWIVIGVANGWDTYVADEGSFFDAGAASYVAVQMGTVVAGGIIALRKSGQLVGWMLMLAGISFWFAWMGLIPLDVFVLNGNFTGAGVLESVINGVATLWVSLIFSALFLFPDGYLISQRWRPVGWLFGITLATGFVASVVNGGWGGDPEEVHYPTPLHETFDPLGDVLSTAFTLLLPVITSAAVVSIVVRFVRSRGVERLQMKLLVFAAVVAMVGLGSLSLVASGAASDTTVQTVIASAAILLIPLSIMFAVMRFGLYEIDRIISRTLAYFVVVVALAGMFAAGVLLIPQLLPASASSLAVAASTLAVAAMFNPVRKRVQRGVDRLFNRSRYDHEEVADAFSARLRDKVNPDDVMGDWVEVVNETMEPASTAFWVRGRS